jgi:hypothetical protein
VLLGLILVVHHSRLDLSTFIRSHDEELWIVNFEHFACIVGVHTSHGSDGESVGCDWRQLYHVMERVGQLTHDLCTNCIDVELGRASAPGQNSFEDGVELPELRETLLLVRPWCVSSCDGRGLWGRRRLCSCEHNFLR